MSGCSVSPSVGMLEHARGPGRGPCRPPALRRSCRVRRLTVTLTAFSTTCQLVRIVPSESITKPEPVAVPCCWRFAEAEGRFALRDDGRGDVAPRWGRRARRCRAALSAPSRLRSGSALRRGAAGSRRAPAGASVTVLRRGAEAAGDGDHGDDDAAADEGGDEGDGEERFMRGSSRGWVDGGCGHSARRV